MRSETARWVLLFVLASGTGRPLFAQTSPAERGYGLTAEEARDGWISLFDGRTTFGWTGAEVTEDGLRGGQGTCVLGPCVLKGEVVRGGILYAAGQSIEVKPGRLELRIAGQSTPIRLGDGVVIRSLFAKMEKMTTIFDGQALDGCRAVLPPNAKPGEAAEWTLGGSWLRAKGGPGAMELPGTYADFALQATIRTNGRHSNGGLFFRNPPGTCMMGYEAQIYNASEADDPARPARYATGALDDRQNARRLVSRDNEPFVLTVIARGTSIATWVNGHQVTDWVDPRPSHESPRQGSRVKPGTIQFQAHDPLTDVDFGPVRIVRWD